MKNKRNTRRGRANRWRRENRDCGAYILRGFSFYAAPVMTANGHATGRWAVLDVCSSEFIISHPSQAAARRCVDAWQRFDISYRRTGEIPAFWTAS